MSHRFVAVARSVQRQNWLGGFLVVACLLAIGSQEATAQGLSTASIIGNVTDESKSVLPGVTISVSSPALQLRQVTTVTDERGAYRIVQLPIGVYEVSYSLDGFETMKYEGVRLAAGFVAKMDVALKVGGVKESIVVTGTSPVVDVTSTRTSTQFLRENLEAIPTSRNSIVSLLNQAPGVNGRLDVGGSNTGLLPSMPVFGRPGQSEPMLEGINGREATGNLGGSYYDYSTFEEAQVETVAHDAESAVSGVRLNAITKAGGNDFHGTIFASKMDPRLQSNNIDDKLKAQGVTAGNPIKTRWDVSGDLGGRIIRDKLWFYGAARRQKALTGIVGLVKPDGSQGFNPLTVDFLTGKVSYQPSPAHRLVAFKQWFRKDQWGGGSQFVPWESQWHLPQPGANSKIEWVGQFGNAIVANAQWGNSWYWSKRQAGLSSDLATYDIATQKYTGQAISQYYTPSSNHIWRHEFKGTLSVYKKDWLYGDHDLKAGGTYFLERRNQPTADRPAGNYVLLFNNGVPYQVRTYNVPVSALNAVNYAGAFFRDKWLLNRRLTLNLGVRWDRYNMFLPKQDRIAGQFAEAASFPKVQFAIWNEIVPRLHFGYDLFGDAKTVIKGGWGRFGDLRDAYDEPSQFQGNQSVSTVWRWSDLNGNRQWDPGEVNLDPNGPGFVSVSSVGVQAIVNPDEKQPKLDEFSLSIERELAPRLAVRVTGVYARSGNNRRLLNTLIPPEAYNIAVTKPDPGADGIVGTPDDPGTTLTYWEFPTSLQGIKFIRNTVVNDPKYKNSWSSVEIAVMKRLSQNWQFQAAFSATKYNMLFPETGETKAIAALNPNASINTLNRTWEWFFRASGSYRLPWDLLASANYQMICGKPWARQVLVTGGKTIPSIVINAEPFGSQRTPAISLLDTRIEKSFRLVGSSKVSLRLDIFNTLNANTPQNVNARAGSSYGVPTPTTSQTAILGPRVAMFGGSFTF